MSRRHINTCLADLCACVFVCARIKLPKTLLLYTLLCIRTSLAPFIFLFAWIRDSAPFARLECYNAFTYQPLPHCLNWLHSGWLSCCAIHISNIIIVIVCSLSPQTTASTCRQTQPALADTFHWALRATKTGKRNRNETEIIGGWDGGWTKYVVWPER